MVIATLCAELFVSPSNSLKDKRMVMRSLKSRLRSTFNVSIAELGNHQKWQRVTIGVAAVGTSTAQLNSVLSHVVNFLEDTREIELLDYEMEMM